MNQNLTHFRLLTTDLFNDEDKAKILANLVDIKTPYSPVGKEYTVEWIDVKRRIAVIKYRGAEVLLFYKRMTSQETLSSLEVANRVSVPLKSEDDAWVAFRLFDSHKKEPLSEIIVRLEHELKEQQGINAQLQLALETSSRMIEIATIRKAKKENKNVKATSSPPLLCSDEVNRVLLKISPLKMQTAVRAFFLSSQGFDTNLKYTLPSLDSNPYNKGTKGFNRFYKLTEKVNKLLKKAIKEKEITTYKDRPPKIKKVKTVTKKTAKKKGKKK